LFTLLLLVAAGIGVVGVLTIRANGQRATTNWDPPAIQVIPDHDALVHDMSLLDDFVDAGRELFRTRFNVIDGAGRPEATGDSKPTQRLRRKDSTFNRIAGPDANSCAGCHNQPIQGGSGDFAVNVFVGAHFTDPPTNVVDPKVTNERNTTSIFGAGAIETLAREMSEDLQGERELGSAQARRTGQNVTVLLSTKGISFGEIVARSDGTYDAKRLHGVDEDLIVKPFGWKGVAVSIREFTNFALNQHHGMQSEERFGWNRTGRRDFDGDGKELEFTVGQVSALTLYQASLPPPRRFVYKDEQNRRSAEIGKAKFAAIGCSQCHVPVLPLRSRWFSEPNPYNRPGTAIPADVAGEISIPFKFGERLGVFQGEGSRLYVSAFTDLKRHRICDMDDPFFCNELRAQDFVPTDEFLTPKLWDVGSSAPYGHRGDLTTVSEAIIHHSAEAKESRNAFLRLSDDEKSSIVIFLLSLRVDETKGPPVPQQFLQPGEDHNAH